MTRTIKTVNDEKTISHIINGKEFSLSKKDTTMQLDDLGDTGEKGPL